MATPAQVSDRPALAHALAAHRPVAVFTAGAVLAFTALGVAEGSPLVVPYLLVVVPLVVLAASLERRFGLGRRLLWALAVWAVAHLAGGLVEVGTQNALYFVEVVPDLLRYDQVVHAYGSACATLVAGRVLLDWTGGRPFTLGPAVLLALVGAGIGAVGEIVEFLVSRAVDVNVGDYANNGWDLVFDLGGAAVAAAAVARGSRRVRPGAGGG